MPSAAELLREIAAKEEWRSHTPQTLAGLALNVEPLLPLIADVVEAAEGFFLDTGDGNPVHVRSPAELDLALTALREALEDDWPVPKPDEPKSLPPDCWETAE